MVTSTVANQIPTFTITETKRYETKLYVPVVTLPTLENAKQLTWININQK